MVALDYICFCRWKNHFGYNGWDVQMPSTTLLQLCCLSSITVMWLIILQIGKVCQPCLWQCYIGDRCMYFSTYSFCWFVVSVAVCTVNGLEISEMLLIIIHSHYTACGLGQLSHWLAVSWMTRSWFLERAQTFFIHSISYCNCLWFKVSLVHIIQIVCKYLPSE
jgi:hypothetical protein